MTFFRASLFVFFVAFESASLRADDILFIGNSFTYGAMAPIVHLHGGVPKLFEAIAVAKGRTVATSAVTAGGKNWAYHLAQPVTAKALNAKPWNWVVLQDFSSEPTRAGNVSEFLHDGETFSARIAQASPRTGIILYETWPRPAGLFYHTAPGNALSGPEQMMDDLHQAYGHLRDNLAAEDKSRDVRVALVGTAFARSEAEYPEINLNAIDAHHATAEGYYLAALVIYETVYHDSAKGAPTTFFDGTLRFPADEAAKLQDVADEVAGTGTK